VIFLAIGMPVKYSLVMPYQFGLLGFPVPNYVSVLEDLAPLSLLMVSYLSAKKGGAWTVAFFVLLIPEVLGELARFSKIVLLMTLVMAILGRYLARPRLSGLVVGAGIVFGCYLLAGPVASLGRLEIARRHGNQYEASLGERIEILYTVVTSMWSDEKQERSEYPWLQRLCYTNAEAFAMHLYDTGSPGDTYSLIGYILVPRMLEPDKPVITDAGYDFTELAYGFRTSLTGIGIFGEAYWNGGWPLVVVACSLLGALFAALSRVSLQIISGPSWPFFLPCVFYGFRFGYRIDGWFVGDYAGHVPIYVVVFCLCYLLQLICQPKVVSALLRPVREGFA
jgi:hypothetical protein